MEPAAALRLEPTLNLCALMGAIVIHDQVDFLIGRELSLQVVKKPDEFTAALTVLAGPITLPLRILKAANKVVVP